MNEYQFDVVESTSKARFIEAVTARLNKGWKCEGGLIVSHVYRIAMSREMEHCNVERKGN